MAKLNHDNRSMATVYEDYDSGEVDGTTTEETISLNSSVGQLLIHPLVDATVKLNDSDKEIYLPAGTWTPISVLTDSFTIKTNSESGKIYWQGWIL